MDHLPILHNCSIMADLFPTESIFPAFRGPINLKEILSKRIDSCITADNPAIETGFFCCSRKCDLRTISPLNLLILLASLLAEPMT